MHPTMRFSLCGSRWAHIGETRHVVLKIVEETGTMLRNSAETLIHANEAGVWILGGGLMS